LRIPSLATRQNDGVLKRLGVILLWLLATVGTASLTYAAVTQADRAVTDAPAGPVAGADIAARIATTTTAAGTDTTGAVATTTTTTVTVPTTAVTSTTVVTGTTLSPPTTTAASTTTTSAASPQWKTVPGVGTVGVSVAGTAVTLISATPVAPYSVDVEAAGPEKVEVDFESGETRYRVRAEVVDGELDWDVSQETEGD
jgi:hypothetical protein